MVAIVLERRQGLLGGLLGGDGSSSDAATFTSSDGGLLSGLTQTAETTSSTTTSAAKTSSSTASTTSSSESESSSSTSASSTSASSSTSTATSSSQNSVSTTTSSPSASATSSSSTPSTTPAPTSLSVYTSSSAGQVVTLTSVVQAESASASVASASSTSFLNNKPLEGGIFALVGIVALVLFILIGTVFLRRRSRKRLDREIADVVSFEPTTDHGEEKAAAPWSRYSTGSTAHGSVHNYPTNDSDSSHGGTLQRQPTHATGYSYGQQQQQQQAYPGYATNQSYPTYGAPAQNYSQYPVPPRSPAVAYNPSRNTHPNNTNPIAPYATPMLPQMNFGGSMNQYNDEKPLPYPTGFSIPAPPAVSGDQGNNNTVNHRTSNPSVASKTERVVNGPEQAPRRSNVVSASVDDNAGYTLGRLMVTNE